MTALFEAILNSRIFKFTVGQNVDDKPTTFTVHEEATAALSQPLQSLLRSGLSESETGHATWEGVSKDTFVRFAQFAYTGDYSGPELVVREVVPLHDEEPVPENEAQHAYEFHGEENELVELVDDGWGGYSTVGKRSKKVKRGFGTAVEEPEPNGPLVRFQQAEPPKPQIHAAGGSPPDSFEPGKKYSGAFVGHASLWVLGDYQLVDSLKALALYKLHQTLSIFQITKENISDVVDLVRFSYSDEGTGNKDGISELRHLVCLFLAMHQKDLREDDGFMELLAEGGNLVKDFFKYSIA